MTDEDFARVARRLRDMCAAGGAIDRLDLIDSLDVLYLVEEAERARGLLAAQMVAHAPLTPAQRKLLEHWFQAEAPPAPGFNNLCDAVAAALALVDRQAADLARHDAMYHDARLDLDAVVRERVLDERRACVAAVDEHLRLERGRLRLKSRDARELRDAIQTVDALQALRLAADAIRARGPAPDPLPAERLRLERDRLRDALAALDAHLDFGTRFAPGTLGVERTAGLNDAAALAAAALREVTP